MMTQGKDAVILRKCIFALSIVLVMVFAVSVQDIKAGTRNRAADVQALKEIIADSCEAIR